MVMTSRDVVFLAIVLAILVVAGVAGVVFRRPIAGLLTPLEWRVLGKLIAILAMILTLVLMNVSLRLPAEAFIYGRF
jgi:hypothetical protein